MGQLEDRKQREIEHSDKRRSIVRAFEYQTDTGFESSKNDQLGKSEEYKKHFSNMKFYSISRTSFAYRDKQIFESVENEVVLDYCCGNGEIALEMARHGASEVRGIDISQVAVDNADKLAKSHGIAEHCTYEVMDAENMAYEDNYFDRIHEYGALHHLELESAFRELSRVLKSDGKLVCTETLRHNPFIHWYRKRTPQLRTDWEMEHILGVPEIMSGLKYFSKVDIKFFHIAALVAVPFRKTVLFKPLLFCLEIFDKFLTRLPGLKKWSWVAVIVYSEPIK